MINKEIIKEINKYKILPTWNYQFPPYVEAHYFDNILVFHYDRNSPNNIFCDKFYQNGAKPSLLIIRFDNQLVFVKYQNSILLDRFPTPPCLTLSNNE